jgi:hypothetical protein
VAKVTAQVVLVPHSMAVLAAQVPVVEVVEQEVQVE